MNEKIKIKFHGIVRTNYYDEETKKRVITFLVNKEVCDFIEEQITSNGMEFSGDSYPIKTDSENGNPYLKTSTSFNISVTGLPYDDYTIDDVGTETAAIVYIYLKEGRYRANKYVSAYLCGLDITDFKDRVDYNVFEDSEFQTAGALSADGAQG